MPHQLSHLCLSVLIAATSGAALAAGPTPAPERDPARWHIEDSTPQMRYQTSKKEAGAAYDQARQECRSMRGTDASACNHEARSNYESDLAFARKKLER